MTYEVRFLDPAAREFNRLPRRIQKQLHDLEPYLETSPYRSYPFLPLKEVESEPGVWRFALGSYRVFFKVDGSTVWIGKFWLRPPAYDRTHLRELRRALRHV